MKDFNIFSSFHKKERNRKNNYLPRFLSILKTTPKSLKHLLSDQEDYLMVIFFRNCIKYKNLFIGITLLTVILNYVFIIRNYEPSYQSQTTLLISRQVEALETLETNVVLQSLQVSERLVNDIPGIIFSTSVLDEINQNLSRSGMDQSTYSMNEFNRQVSTEIITNSRIIQIYVVNSNPETAHLIASTIASSTKELVKELYRQDYVVIIKEAELPTAPGGLSTKALWIVGMMGGILIGFLALLIITVTINHKEKENVTISR